MRWCREPLRPIGLVVGDIENPFFAAVARGLSDMVESQGYTVLLTNADEDPERERRAMLALRSRRVDGMVVVPAPGAGRDAFVEARRWCSSIGRCAARQPMR